MANMQLKKLSSLSKPPLGAGGTHVAGLGRVGRARRGGHAAAWQGLGGPWGRGRVGGARVPAP